MKKNNGLKVAAAYIRVSTDKQEELSPESQKDKLMEFAHNNGYYLPNEYIFWELGVSGRKADKRPEFQRMIGLAKSSEHPIDAILVWKFSRFARNQEESIVYKSMLKKDGVDVVSVSEYISDDMFGKLIERIIEWMDEYYSIRLSGDVFRGMHKKAELGGYQSSPPLGYKMLPGNNNPVVVPEQAAIIKKIFDLYVNQKLSMYAICVKLNELGAKTKQGKSFQKRSVEYILKNPTYCGYIRWNMVDSETQTEKDKEEWIIEKGSFEPIISEEIYKLANERIEKEYIPRKAKPVYNQKHWLSGMVKCSACGRSLALGHTAKNGVKYYYLECYGVNKALCTVSHRISVIKFVPHLLNAIKEAMESLELEYEIIQKQVVNDDTDLVNTQLERLAQQEMRARESYMAGVDTLGEYKAAKEMILKEKKRLEEALKEIKQDLPKTEDTDRIMKERIANVYALLSDPDVSYDIKATALRSIVKKIIFNRPEKNLDVFYYYS